MGLGRCGVHVAKWPTFAPSSRGGRALLFDLRLASEVGVFVEDVEEPDMRELLMAVCAHDRVAFGREPQHTTTARNCTTLPWCAEAPPET